MALLKLICYSCNTHHKETKMQAEIISTNPQTKESKVIGYLCAKCNKKNAVSKRPKGMGWRSAFQKLVQQAIQNKINEKVSYAKSESLAKS